MPKGQPHSRKEIAAIVAESLAETDEIVAERHGISTRSIRGWRKRCKRDDLLMADVENHAQILADAWKKKVPPAMCAALDYIRRACSDESAPSPEMLKAVSDALKAVGEVAIAYDMIGARMKPDVRSNDPNRGNGKAPRQMATGSLYRAAG